MKRSKWKNSSSLDAGGSDFDSVSYSAHSDSGSDPDPQSDPDSGSGSDWAHWNPHPVV